MVNANVKTPKKNRKSLANAAGSPNPQAGNVNPNVKTPGKNRNASPTKKQNFTPGNKQNSPNNKPGFSPGKKQNSGPSPAGKNVNAGASPNKKQIKVEPQSPKQAAKPAPVKRSNDSNAEASPPKKLKKFAGNEGVVAGAKKQKSAALKEEHKQRKTRNSKVFKVLKEKIGAGDQSVLKNIEEKIKTFEARQELSKTAKRKLKVLQRLKRKVTGEAPLVVTPAQKKNERKKKAKTNVKAAQAAKVAPKQEVQAAAEEDSDSDEESVDLQLGQIIKTDNVSGNDSDDDDDDDDEDGQEEESDEGEESLEEEEVSGDEEEESDEADSDEVPELVQAPAAGKTVKATPTLQQLKDKQLLKQKQTRYVIFVGNLAYDTTRDELAEHFSKAGNVRHIRIPLDQKTNKPRGFAYVEFDNEISYQKGLSLHHSFLKGRRVNVQYTQGGKKKGAEQKKEVKAKNLKLQAMRKQGQLAGSGKQNQKRAARRNKKNASKVNGA